MTRVVCLLGSPRNRGNSDILAHRFCAAAKECGAQTRTHSLRDLRFQGYTEYHHPDKRFDADDDMVPVLADVEAADILVIATPIYFDNICGLMKLALDRFYAFLVPDYMTSPTPSRLGKERTLVFIQTQGEGEGAYADVLAGYGKAFDKLGFSRRHVIRACNAIEVGDVLHDPKVLEKTDRLAKRLAGSVSEMT